MKKSTALEKTSTKISERVASSIRKLIADNALVDGDEIGSEAELIIRFRASRPSIREAIRVLESEGLVQIVKGARSVRVQSPTPALPARYAALVLRSQSCSIADAYRARSMLEPAAIQELIRHAPDEDLAILDDILAEEIRAASEDPLRFGTLTIHFHEALVGLSGNKTTLLLLTLLRSIFENHFRSTMAGASASNIRRAIQAHRIIITLIRKRDEVKAKEFWARHLEMVEDTMSRAHGYHDIVSLQDSD